MARFRYERHCEDKHCTEGRVADDLECLLRAATTWQLYPRGKGVKEAREYLKYLTASHAISLSTCGVCKRRGVPLNSSPWLACPVHRRLECDKCRCLRGDSDRR